MKIVLVGAGNLATNLGKALKTIGEDIAQVYSRTEESASVLGNLLEVPYTTCLSDILDDASLYIVSLKDSVLPEILPVLVKGRKNALFIHTAGSIPLSIWDGITSRGGVFYPMQTFSKKRTIPFQNIPCFIEAKNEKDRDALYALAHRLSQKVYCIDSEQRKYLHLAAVFACNFTNQMYSITEQLLQQQGIPFDVMLPLIDETASKVHELSPLKSQTGPAVRYDTNVINQQLVLLAKHPQWQVLYDEISKSIHYDQLRLKES